MYFIENCLLYSFLSLVVYHSTGTVFYLHCPNALTGDVSFESLQYNATWKYNMWGYIYSRGSASRCNLGGIREEM